MTTMPSCTIIPVLGYKNLPDAIAWLSTTFGFVERWRIGNHRAQLRYEDGAIAITGQSSPPASLLVRVKNVNEHHANAEKQGARILQAPTDFPYGERQYTVEDLGGHRWTFSETIREMSPEEWGAEANA